MYKNVNLIMNVEFLKNSQGTKLFKLLDMHTPSADSCCMLQEKIHVCMKQKVCHLPKRPLVLPECAEDLSYS